MMAATERAKGESGRDRTDQAINEFCDRASKLPQVIKIAVEQRGPRNRLWTVISAPAFDRSYRSPIYRMEQDLQVGDPETWDFRLLNLKELPDPTSDPLPSGAVLLFARV
jgi:hypothetical protein